MNRLKKVFNKFNKIDGEACVRSFAIGYAMGINGNTHDKSELTELEFETIIRVIGQLSSNYDVREWYQYHFLKQLTQEL